MSNPEQKPAVRSHPRSGTNFLAASLALNYYPARSGHWFLMRKRTHYIPTELNPGLRYLYIWRPFEPVVESLWRLRKAFAIKEDDREKFMNSTYRQSTDPDAKTTWKREGVVQHAGAQRHIPAVNLSNYFDSIDLCPYDFWQEHVRAWKKLASENSNVLIVRYDDLNENFDKEMARVSKHIGAYREKYLRPLKAGIEPFEEEDHNET